MALRSVIRRGPICMLIEKLASCLASGAQSENTVLDWYSWRRMESCLWKMNGQNMALVSEIRAVLCCALRHLDPPSSPTLTSLICHAIYVHFPLCSINWCSTLMVIYRVYPWPISRQNGVSNHGLSNSSPPKQALEWLRLFSHYYWRELSDSKWKLKKKTSKHAERVLGEGDNNTTLIDVLRNSSLRIIRRKQFLQQDLCTVAEEFGRK